MIWSKISDECKDLIKNMLEIQPNNRYSTMDILKSSFIQKYSNLDFTNEVINLKSAKSFKSFKKIKSKNS